MGLLDMFSSADPGTQQGLLGAAAALLQAGGPSLRPISVGQGLGGAISAFQQGQSLAQQQALRALQVKAAQGELDDQQRARDQADRLRQFYANYQTGAGAGTQPSTGAPAASGAAPAQSIMFQAPGAGLSSAPDWMQAYQQSNTSSAPAAAAPAAAAAAPANDLFHQRLALASALRQKGFNAEADAQEAAALKFQPKYSTDFRTAMGADGQLHNYVLADDGTLKDTGLGVKPDLKTVDLGGSQQFYNANSTAPGTVLKKTATPGEVLSANQSAARLAFDKSQADSNQDAPLDPLAVRLVAQQYLAGDKSALQNYGRGTQGAQNLNLIRAEIAKQAVAAGMTGNDIAARIAEFEGLKSGQRTAGTRNANIEIAANEAAQLAPLALDASNQVARSGLLPFGKAQIMFDSNTNDPNLRRFAMANQALVTAYAQAISRGGAATVSDKQHAQDLLSTAQDQPSYAAAVGQMMKEIDAARSAPKAVSKSLSAGVSGQGDGGAQPAAAAPTGAKTATLSDIAATARASGRSTAEVTAALRAKGYTITGG